MATQSEIDGSVFDAHYYAHDCSRPYRRDASWLAFFDGIAERIVEDLAPSTVLDAGCAFGFLVEALRRRGVEAYGIDISEYAISQVHPDVSPYCWVGSVTQPFPQRYDLIVSIEVLEHLPRHQADKAVANLCDHTDEVLFSASPVDYREPTHMNVQPPAYWANLFMRHGLYRDPDYDADFITPWAARFRREKALVSRVMVPYERQLWRLRKENDALRAQCLDLQAQLSEARSEDGGHGGVAALQHELAQCRAHWADLENTPGWRVMQWLQRLRATLAPPGTARDRILNAILGGRETTRRTKT
ncbi:MAG: class I SAM-dependent methyltransferase [Anaerolineae bacterium]